MRIRRWGRSPHALWPEAASLSRKAHRCPFWLVCLRNGTQPRRGPWCRWGLFNLAGPSIFHEKATWRVSREVPSATRSSSSAARRGSTRRSSAGPSPGARGLSRPRESRARARCARGSRMEAHGSARRRGVKAMDIYIYTHVYIEKNIHTHIYIYIRYVYIYTRYIYI